VSLRTVGIYPPQLLAKMDVSAALFDIGDYLAGKGRCDEVHDPAFPWSAATLTILPP
jgi:hypothetical protein